MNPTDLGVDREVPSSLALGLVSLFAPSVWVSRAVFSVLIGCSSTPVLMVALLAGWPFGHSVRLEIKVSK